MFQEDVFGDLTRVLSLYLNTYRSVLLRQQKHDYIFFNTKGCCFESSAFSHYLAALLHRLSGTRPTSNILRSSFVSYLMDSPEGHDPVVRASAAKMLHHSEVQQRETYDRRNPADRKRAGMLLLGVCNYILNLTVYI